MRFTVSTIGEIASIQTGPFGSQLHKEDYVPVGTPIVTVEHLGQRKLTRQNLPCVSDTDKARLSKYTLKYGDLVFSRVGSVDRCSLVSEDENGWMFSGRCLRVRSLDNEAVYHKYLYYFFTLEDTKDFVRNIAVGATMPSINTKLLSEIPIRIPHIEHQRAIADTLSALDDRIEKNRAINNHLEQMAQAIFKSWFVDFEPFGGLMPEDWQEGTLGQFVEIKRGGSPRPIQEFLSDSGYRWLKISDVSGLQTPFVLEIKEHIKESGLNKTVLRKTGTLVLSNSATPGIPKILGVDTCIHDGWLYFPQSRFSNEYLYLFFKFIRQDLVALGNGSVFTNLKTDILKAFPSTFPGNKVLSRFDDVVVPLFKGMELATRESARLAEIRDTLLPRLMSGELSVADVTAK